MGKWYPAKIVDMSSIYNLDKKIKVSFSNYGAKYDEVIMASSGRLAKLGTYTNGVYIPFSEQSTAYKVGDVVDVLDKVCKWYPAKILKIEEGERGTKYTVNFSGWEERHNETIDIPSRIAKLGTYTNGVYIPKESKKPFTDAEAKQLKIGDAVDIFSRGAWHVGKICGAGNTGTTHFYSVLFGTGSNISIESDILTTSGKLAKAGTFSGNVPTAPSSTVYYVYA